MDIKEQYEELTEKMKEALPLKAYPIREIVSIFRDNGKPITLKTELTITTVFNSGDISGIMCTVEAEKDNAIACGLTHLIFKPGSPLYKEIAEYQKKRCKRIKKLNKITGN